LVGDAPDQVGVGTWCAASCRLCLYKTRPGCRVSPEGLAADRAPGLRGAGGGRLPGRSETVPAARRPRDIGVCRALWSRLAVHGSTPVTPSSSWASRNQDLAVYGAHLVARGPAGFWVPSVNVPDGRHWMHML